MYSRVGGAWARKRDRKEKLFPSSASLAAKSLFPLYLHNASAACHTLRSRTALCTRRSVLLERILVYCDFLLFQEPFGAICSDLPKFCNALNFFSVRLK